jgi:hypothetical protein
VPTELDWTWTEIAVTLMWRLAPNGCVITRKDLAALPVDRVLIEDRTPTEIRFSWSTVEEAQRLRKPLADGGQKAGLSQLQGRWQKMAVVLLWKLAKDGIVLTPLDRSAVPADKQLLAHGHAQDIEYRFLPHAEAAAIARRERDNEGRIILEAGRV